MAKEGFLFNSGIAANLNRKVKDCLEASKRSQGNPHASKTPCSENDTHKRVCIYTE
jgi:hypothetical protein